MNSNDRYNIIKELLEKGEKDLLKIGEKAEYKGSTEKRIKDSTKRFIRNHEVLQLLFEGSEKTLENKELKEIEKDPYKNNNKAPVNIPMELDNISTWNELVETQPNNIFLTLLNKELQEIKNNNGSHNDNNIKDYHFILDEKYLDFDKDDYITASLRLVRKTKKRLDKFAEKNGQYKKILLVSQLLDEIMDKYE